jgi:hypothetical protein
MTVVARPAKTLVTRAFTSRPMTARCEVSSTSGIRFRGGTLPSVASAHWDRPCAGHPDLRDRAALLRLG